MDLLQRLSSLYGTEFKESDSRTAMAILRRVPMEAREDILSLVVVELDVHFKAGEGAVRRPQAKEMLQILGRITKRLQRDVLARADQRSLDLALVDGVGTSFSSKAGSKASGREVLEGLKQALDLEEVLILLALIKKDESMESLAEQLNVSVRTMRRRIAALRAKVKRYLESH